MDSVQLRKLIDDRFSDSELRDLCFELGLDYDDVSGSNRKDKTRELIVSLERRNRLDELRETIQRLRPDIAWDEI
jgi:hypothetical protein